MESEERQEEPEDETLKIPDIREVTKRFSFKSDPITTKGQYVFKIIEITLLIIFLIIAGNIAWQKGYCKPDPVLCDATTDKCYSGKVVDPDKCLTWTEIRGEEQQQDNTFFGDLYG